MSDTTEHPRFAPRLAVRHVQLGRAVLAAIAALMITFSPDHSAAVGLAVFSGFAVTTAILLGFAAWMAYPAGRRSPTAALAIVTAVGGMIGGVPVWRTTELFFALVIGWALVAGAIELVAGWRARRSAGSATETGSGAGTRSEARDAMTVGIVGLVLGIGLALVPAGYRLDYFIDDADQWFTLTGTTIGVGIFGAYTAIVAVYLGIAGFSPRRESPAAASVTEEAADPAQTGDAG